MDSHRNSLKRELDALSKQEKSLHTELENVIAKRARVHVECYGPFSFFSMLPLEILFYIMELVFSFHFRDRCTLGGSFNIFVTCKAAFSLKDTWYNYIYARLGSISCNFMPPVEVFLAKFPKYSSQLSAGVNLLEMGIDPFKVANGGIICLSQPQLMSGLRVIPKELKCAEMTRTLVKFDGLRPLDIIIHNDMVDTIPYREWLARVKREKLEHILSDDYFFMHEYRTVLSLVNRDTCTAIFNATLRHKRRIGCEFVERLGKMLTLIQPCWFTCWQDIYSFAHWDDALIEAVLRYAPTHLLTLPFITGGGVEDNPLFNDINFERLVDIDVGIIKSEGRPSRLNGVVMLNRTIYLTTFYVQTYAEYPSYLSMLGFQIETEE